MTRREGRQREVALSLSEWTTSEGRLRVSALTGAIARNGRKADVSVERQGCVLCCPIGEASPNVRYRPFADIRPRRRLRLLRRSSVRLYAKSDWSKELPMPLSALLIPLVSGLSAGALDQGIFVTGATYWAHCSARLAVEGSRAGNRSDAATLETLSEQALQRARAAKNRGESDELLLRYASNMRASIEERRDDPSYAPGLERAALQCRARIEEAAE